MVQNVEERVPGSHSFSFTGNVLLGQGTAKAFTSKPTLIILVRIGACVPHRFPKIKGSPFKSYILKAEGKV